jgi:hypothetical protein
MTAAQLQFFLSAQPGSTGGALGTLQIDPTVFGQLFGPVWQQGLVNGWTDYRKVFAVNLSGTDILSSAVLWILQQPGAGQQISIGLGGDDDTDGTVIQYGQPMNQASAIALGNINPGQAIPIWIQRVIPAGSPMFSICNFQLVLSGEA